MATTAAIIAVAGFVPSQGVRAQATTAGSLNCFLPGTPCGGGGSGIRSRTGATPNDGTATFNSIQQNLQREDNSINNATNEIVNRIQQDSNNDSGAENGDSADGAIGNLDDSTLPSGGRTNESLDSMTSPSVDGPPSPPATGTGTYTADPGSVANDLSDILDGTDGANAPAADSGESQMAPQVDGLTPSQDQTPPPPANGSAGGSFFSPTPEHGACGMVDGKYFCKTRSATMGGSRG